MNVPIAFASKQTPSAEQNYKPFLLKFAALKFGLDHFSDIIWGFPIEIETDCQALKHVLSNDCIIAAHACWRDGIIMHNIVAVQHIPGCLNVVTDRLSCQWDNTEWNGKAKSTWLVSPDPEAMSRPVLRRSYLSGGQGVRAWSSGKTERLRSVVVLPEG